MRNFTFSEQMKMQLKGKEVINLYSNIQIKKRSCALMFQFKAQKGLNENS